MSNIASLLWTAAAEHPAQPAIIERGSAIDYDALLRRAAATAAGLIQHGLKPHERVGIFLDGGAEAIGAFFGVAAAGGIAIVINESLRPRQVEHILEASGATTLITSEDLLARQPRQLETRTRLLLAPMLEDLLPVTYAPVPRSGMDPAQIVFTSGSTGLPKGVTVTHVNLLAAAETVIGYPG